MEFDLQYRYGYATVPQLIWCCLGVVGVFFTVLLWIEAYRDLQALKRQANFHDGGSRHISAKSYLRSVQQKTVVLLCFTIAGIVTITFPTTLIVNSPTPGGLLTAGVLIFAELTLVAGAIQDRRDRDAVLFQIRARKVDELREEIQRAQQQIANSPTFQEHLLNIPKLAQDE